MTGKPRHFIDIADHSADEIEALLAHGKALKARRRKGELGDYLPLLGKKIAVVFQQPSLRTRMSFDVGINELGAHVLMVSGDEIELGHRESISDTARVMSRYVDAIMIRTDDHAKVEELARHASVPVINGLTDLSHPCQIVADLLTVMEHGKALPGLEIAWLGDGNNVLNSVVEAAGLFKFNVRIAVPEGYESDSNFMDVARAAGANITLTRDAGEAVAGADVVVTDTWVSMGQEHAHNKIAAMMPYQVNARLMALAKADAKFLHCLPAHRGEEVTDAVIDGPQSVIWDEAENRLHAQKSILLWCLGKS